MIPHLVGLFVLAGYLAYRDSYPCIVILPMERNPFVHVRVDRSFICSERRRRFKKE